MKLLLLAYSLLGPPCEVYTTVAASDAWIATTQQLSLKKQVAAVRQRLACDARVRPPREAAALCVACLTAEGQRAFRDAQEKQRQADVLDPRPLGVALVYLIDGQMIAPADTAQWQPLLARRQVQKIELVVSKNAAVIGGAWAQNGMVFITTRHRP